MFFDFECPTHGTFEEMVRPPAVEFPCPHCGLNASRVPSTFRIDHLRMAMSNSASPESIDKFERAHRQQKEKEAKCEANNGDYGPRPGAD